MPFSHTCRYEPGSQPEISNRRRLEFHELAVQRLEAFRR